MKNLVPNRKFYGSSFHGATIDATLDELVSVLGNPHFVTDSIGAKTQNEWGLLMTDDENEAYEEGISLYDWKEYRTYQSDETIEWHIGGSNDETDMAAKKIIDNKLDDLRKQ